MTRLCNSTSTRVFYIVFKEFKDKFYHKNFQLPKSCNVDGSSMGTFYDYPTAYATQPAGSLDRCP